MDLTMTAFSGREMIGFALMGFAAGMIAGWGMMANWLRQGTDNETDEHEENHAIATTTKAVPPARREGLAGAVLS